MELQGIIKKVGEVQTFPSGFQKKRNGYCDRRTVSTTD